MRESQHKDLLLSWNDSLGQKVAEQTKEIRAAYELEQKAKWELEKLNETKDRFITLTQHNMRVPLTSLQHSLKLGNSTDASLSADNLARIIDDFRNIAGMKPGSKILNMGIHNCKGMIEETVRELGVDIRRMNIVVKYPQDTASWPNLHMDGNKMKEVIVILLENAIKYNIQGGRVDICTATTEDAFELSITNTGLGISSEEKENIENKSFYRGIRAHTVNPIGMGVGLRIATAIVNGHNGILALTSDGIDRDVTAKITLPLRQARS